MAGNHPGGAASLLSDVVTIAAHDEGTVVMTLAQESSTCLSRLNAPIATVCPATPGIAEDDDASRVRPSPSGPASPATTRRSPTGHRRRRRRRPCPSIPLVSRGQVVYARDIVSGIVDALTAAWLIWHFVLSEADG